MAAIGSRSGAREQAGAQDQRDEAEQQGGHGTSGVHV